MSIYITEYACGESHVTRDVTKACPVCGARGAVTVAVHNAPLLSHELEDAWVDEELSDAERRITTIMAERVRNILRDAVKKAKGEK